MTPHSRPLTRTILLYGAALATLVVVLKVIEYRYLVHDLTLEFYLGLTATIFAALGVWGGLRLVKPKVIVVNQPTTSAFQLNEAELKRRGISPRELEVLEKMAKGLSNQEIADQLFVSLNTIKTHSASLYSKLDAKRRTQAIQKAKELQLIP